jgi:hypothetical protein
MNVSRKVIHTIAAAAVVAVTLGSLAASPASAEGWRDHDRRGWHEREWREHDWRWRRPYYVAPSYYYPPPVVYAPPPVYAAPPSINFAFRW